VVSKRHCAVIVRADQVFIRDFESTNGTFVNYEPVKGERELKDQDRLKVGPLLFGVRIEAAAATPPPPSKPTPPPAAKTVAGSEDDESAAALLLALQDDGATVTAGGEVDSQGVPTGSTVMEIATPTDGNAPPSAESEKAKKAAAAKQAAGNTSTAAKAILEKYMRRPRT
jgi:predicted component of type VI protein secretion system